MPIVESLDQGLVTAVFSTRNSCNHAIDVKKWGFNRSLEYLVNEAKSNADNEHRIYMMSEEDNQALTATDSRPSSKRPAWVTYIYASFKFTLRGNCLAQPVYLACIYLAFK